MINNDKRKQVIRIWTSYIANNNANLDTNGNVYDDIDRKRLEAIETLKMIVGDLLVDRIDLAEFKTDIDSFNKKNNLWGFTSIKGQMFFNLLVKTADDQNESELTSILKKGVSEPKNLADALNKIGLLDKYVSEIFNKAPDKRKVPNPGSIGYFLSYFWQTHDYEKWPIMYSSLIVSYTDLGLWDELAAPKDAYRKFYELNESVKNILSKHTGRTINNWEAEHAFWNFRTVTAYPKTEKPKGTTAVIEEKEELMISTLKSASFSIYDYIPPVTAKLIELGGKAETNNTTKGHEFEKVSAEVFKQLGFYVQPYGQGTGREPDFIAIHKEDNVAFIVDAKAYTNGYSMGASDERAIKEYIAHYCPKLAKDGIKKVGFIIISNDFKSNLDDFVNDVTWNTPIKRFSLLTSDALLHLLAYKMKDQISPSEIVASLITFKNVITKEDVIQKFDDV